MKTEPFKHQEQLARLVAAHCDETITDEEFAQLEQLLQEQPEARAFYRRYLNLDGSLSDFGRTEAPGWSGQEQDPVAKPVTLALGGGRWSGPPFGPWNLVVTTTGAPGYHAKSCAR